MRLKLVSPLPAATPRRVYGTVNLPGKATAVIGMRRAGKTTFLRQLGRERLERGVTRERLPYINFEDERLAGLEARHLHLLVKEYYRQFPALRGQEIVTWCLDEIQVVPGWERFVRRLLDTEQVELVLSGSSTALLSREVATSTRGRGWEVAEHPKASLHLVTLTPESACGIPEDVQVHPAAVWLLGGGARSEVETTWAMRSSWPGGMSQRWSRPMRSVSGWKAKGSPTPSR